MRAIALALLVLAASSLLGCKGAGPQPGGGEPQAVLNASQTNGPAVLQVDFSAAQSTSPSAITRYEWDFNGDGAYDYDSGNVPTATFFYYTPGAYTVNMRLTNADSKTDTDTTVITVAAGATWHAATAVLGLQDVTQVEMLDVGGNPALFFTEKTGATTYRLAYVRATDADGAAWGAQVELAKLPDFNANADSMKFTAPMILGGKPAVVLQVHVPGGMMGATFSYLIKAQDALGAAWAAAINMNYGSDVGTPVELASGAPAYLCHYGGFGAFGYNFISATTVDCSAWNPVVGFRDASDRYSFDTVSLAMVNGRPALAVADAARGLCFMRSDDANGAAWPMTEVTLAGDVKVDQVPLIVDTLGLTGALPPTNNGFQIDPHLLVAGGIPAMVYWDVRTLEVKFVRALDADGAGWGLGRTLAVGALDNQSNVNAAVTQVGGRPVVLYHTGANAVSFIAANDAAGASWSFPVALGELANVPSHLSVVNSRLAYCLTTNIEGGSITLSMLR